MPHLQYGILAWGNTYPSYINQLHIIQKKTLRIINNSKFAEHSSSLFHKYRILTVFDLYKYHLGVLMYKFETIYPKLYTCYSIEIWTFTLMTQGQLLTFISIKLERLFIYQLSEIKDLFYGTNSNQCLPLNHWFTLRSI